MKDKNLTDFGVKATASSFYKRLAQDETYKRNVQETEQGFINKLNGHMIHDFRYYQREAVSAFDFFINQNRENYQFKDELFEEEVGERTLEEEIPFYGFEMATGSGKTLIIGALILYLHEKLGKENFLFLTKGTTIYDKTIKNFDLTHKDRIFSNNLDLDYNVVTGENFMNRSCDYDEDADFTVFIFNIEKFFDRSSGELKVKKPWEQSVWKNERGDTISLYEYLKNDEDLTIITDEAHHFQKFRYVDGRNSKSSGDIIVNLHPDLVLEFTATALTEDESDQRRNQKIIYDYPLHNFINDGYGKKPRAYGHAGSLDKASTSEVTENDKRKFLVSLLIHLVKKEALSEEDIKPILLLRARRIPHANNLVRWIRNDLPSSEELVERMYNRTLGGPKFDIIELIDKYVSLDKFKKEINKLPKKAFAYHTENDDEEEIKNKVENIETNNQEVLIQIGKLEEGWDIENPYTILILSVSRGNLKTYVKQLIGRGLRLFREKRTKGDLVGYLDPQQEILHVVCEKGDNFEGFIENIRDDLGLTEGTLETEKITEKRKNKTIVDLEDFEQFARVEVPKIKKSKVYSAGTEKLLEDITYENLGLDSFAENKTFYQNGTKYWEWEEEFGKEIDITEEIDLEREEGEFESRILELRKAERDVIVREVIKSQTVLPSHPAVKTKLREALKRLENQEIKYKKKTEDSRKFYVDKLSKSLMDFLVEAIDKHLEEAEEFSKETISEAFPEESVQIELDPESKNPQNVKSKGMNPERIGDMRNYYIKEFDKSYYEYNWFESKQEYMLAYQLDSLDEIDFWIRNRRSYWLEYGVGRRYHPDFVVKTEDGLYVVEVKGEGYLENTRTKKEKDILKDFRERGHNTLFLIDSDIEDKIYKRARSFEDVRTQDSLERA